MIASLLALESYVTDRRSLMRQHNSGLPSSASSTSPQSSAPLALPQVGTSGHYPKPGETGGVLIRKVVAHLKAQSIELPLSTSHILIACSGGADSVALARLIIKYGRRITGAGGSGGGVGSLSKAASRGPRTARLLRKTPAPRISLLHVNHGWRGEDSEKDAEFVRSLGKEWGVPTIIRRVAKGSQKLEGESWEDLARRERRRIFIREAQRTGGIVLTAHHSEDLAETVFWRLLTGAIRTHNAGIQTRFEEQLRPLLTVRKKMLTRFLIEEGVAWRHDSTNEDTRFLRARMRHEVFPVLEGVFPQAVEHLAEMGLAAQRACRAASPVAGALIPPVRVKRAHWEALERLEAPVAGTPTPKQIHLPEGWKISRESPERWVLERQPSVLTTRAKQSEPKRKSRVSSKIPTAP
jgi:tRNA(Ile)-lysidine synthetase-like protein